MSPFRSRPSPLHAVTFDCWGTLIFEPDPLPSFARRLEALRRAAQEAGVSAGAARLQGCLERGWRQQIALWEEGVGSGAREIAGWALAELGVDDEDLTERLGLELGDAALVGEVVALAGARETLARLAGAGVRRALVCDTGFTPGRVVRQLLDREGLLEHLEVCVFSDEAGVPKPHPRVFQAALDSLDAAPADAAHVGDLRRTDIAGGRAAGMGTVRIRWHHDDDSEHPEADAVVDSHAHLLEILGF